MFERTSAHLIQPPNQSRARCKVTPNCLGFYWVESWKISLVEAVQHVWTASSTGGWFSWWKCFSLYWIWSFHFTLSWLLSSHSAPVWRAHQCLPGGPELWIKSWVFSRLASPGLCSLSLQGESRQLGCFLLDLSLCCVRGPKGPKRPQRVWSDGCCAEGNKINPSLASPCSCSPCGWSPNSVASSRAAPAQQSPGCVVAGGCFFTGAGLCLCPNEFRKGPIASFPQPVMVPLKGSPEHTSCCPEAGVICKLDNRSLFQGVG